MARLENPSVELSSPGSDLDTLEQQQPELEQKPIGRLTVNVEPHDARVRIMNIAPKYRSGIELILNQSYDIYITRAGYKCWHKNIVLKELNQRIDVVLEKAVLEPELLNIPGRSFRMGGLSGGSGKDEKPQGKYPPVSTE